MINLRKPRNTSFIAVLIAIFCQLPSFAQQGYLAGFSHETAGTNFAYHSPYSHNDKCLLSRANKDFPAIEWETAVVPKTFKEETVSFIWLYAIDTRPAIQDFDFYVNNELVFTFSNPTSNSSSVWEVKGKNDITLTFNNSMTDKHGDQMGFAVLSIPTKAISLGKAVKLRVDGVNNQSPAWYMTFKIELENKTTAEQIRTVANVDGQLFHTVRFNIIHLGQPSKATINIDDQQQDYELNIGLNEIDFLVEKVNAPTKVKASISIEGKPEDIVDIELRPVKEWTIYLVQHSHTDIGYTRQQSEILAEHLRYIDYALDYCDQTDHLPKDAQFKWTCEATWVVREYLNSRPQEQIDRLLQRLKEGRIEITAMFFNYSEVVDETGLAIQTQTLKQFKDMGIEINTAMQNDVNGIGWCLVDHFQNTGVHYVVMGQHGHRARIPFDKPTAFWWESPSGNRMLAYRSEHYMHGNTLGLISGDIKKFKNNLSRYLDTLEEKDYPFDQIAVQFSGYITDNAPPSTKACSLVKKWNEQHEWPKLKLATASDFPHYIEEHHATELKTKQVAWPDWWTDGFGTAMNETKAARTSHSNMIATTGILSMAQAKGAEIPKNILNDIRHSYDNLLFYDEHTFGAAESISDPSSENSVNQWRQKSAYVWSAMQQSNLLREKAIGIIQPYIEKPKPASVTVFNTLNWTRTGIVEVFIDNDILPLDKEFTIWDANGKTVPAQIINSRNEGSRWALWVKNVPALGYTTLTIEVLDKALMASPSHTSSQNTLENEYYKMVFDKRKNGVVSLIDKKNNTELIDKTTPYGMGTFLYERIGSRSDLERLTHLNRDTVYRPFERTLQQIENIEILGISEGPIYSSINFSGQLPDCADGHGVQMEIRLFNHAPKIELLYQMRKLAVTDPEAVYVAFPFALQDGTLAFEAQGGIVEPGKNQLEGTASDWNTVQNFATVRGPGSQIVFCSNDVPLVQFGDINTGHYYYKHQPKEPHIYSWVLNNYWTTNFRASQQGELKWSYQITSSKDNSNNFATRFGMENRIPMIARANPANNHGQAQTSETILPINTPDNLALISSRPSLTGNGIILHLRETEGKTAQMDVSDLLEQSYIKSIHEANSLEENLTQISEGIKFKPWESKFVVVETGD